MDFEARMAKAFGEEPAFARYSDENTGSVGMDKRTYIATYVIAAIALDTMNCGEKPEYAANAAVKFADALIAELSKS